MQLRSKTARRRQGRDPSTSRMRAHATHTEYIHPGTWFGCSRVSISVAPVLQHGSADAMHSVQTIWVEEGTSNRAASSGARRDGDTTCLAETEEARRHAQPHTHARNSCSVSYRALLPPPIFNPVGLFKVPRSTREGTVRIGRNLDKAGIAGRSRAFRDKGFDGTQINNLLRSR